MELLESVALFVVLMTLIVLATAADRREERKKNEQGEGYDHDPSRGE